MSPSRSWRKAWPAWLLLAAFLALALVSLVTAILAPNVGSPWWPGLLFLAYFGLPLLAAWGVWALLGWRHWALRLLLYVALLIALTGGLFWFVVRNLPIL